MAGSDHKVILYYFPGSYYSQKAMIALYEKGVQFEEKYVFIVTGEQNKEWYRKINKRGVIPTLMIDGECFPESEMIIDVLDKKFLQGPKLVPDVETGIGGEVKSFRALLNKIPIDCITYGIICNQELSLDTSILQTYPPQILGRESSVKRFSRELEELRKIVKTCEGEDRQQLESKMADIAQRMDIMVNLEKVEQLLVDLDPVFDKMEARLQITKRENPMEPGIYLFGANFTAADLTAAVLFLRLQMLGLTSRYFSDTKRPIVNDYYKQILERPSVKKVDEKMKVVQSYMKFAVLKKIGVKVLKAGLVLGLVGLGIYGVREYFKRSQAATQ